MMTDDDLLIAIDFEASCLPEPGRRSFPIEVGIAFIGSGEIRSWLIRPTDQWLSAGFWDSAAEKLHGLSVEQLQRDGSDVDVVRRELAAAVAGRIVVSDNRSYDHLWARVLYDERPPFEPSHFGSVLYTLGGLHDLLGFRDALVDAKRAATLRSPKTHRAGPDAHWLAEVCRLMRRWGSPR